MSIALSLTGIGIAFGLMGYDQRNRAASAAGVFFAGLGVILAGLIVWARLT